MSLIAASVGENMKPSNAHGYDTGLEYCTPESGHTLGSINIPNVRKLCIAACLDAVQHGYDFCYTDLFIGGSGWTKVYRSNSYSRGGYAE